MVTITFNGASPYQGDEIVYSLPGASNAAGWTTMNLTGRSMTMSFCVQSTVPVTAQLFFDGQPDGAGDWYKTAMIDFPATPATDAGPSCTWQTATLSSLTAVTTESNSTVSWFGIAFEPNPNSVAALGTVVVYIDDVSVH
jgi:hypothetical protein